MELYNTEIKMDLILFVSIFWFLHNKPNIYDFYVLIQNKCILKIIVSQSEAAIINYITMAELKSELLVFHSVQQ